MREVKLFILLSLILFTSSCKDHENQETILSLVNTALKDSGIKENKTLLVVSEVDCGTCFVTELGEFLKTEKLDATLVVGFEDSKGKGLDKKVSELLSVNAIPIFKKESLELLIEIGKYSGSPQSPYILRYMNKKLQIESLVHH